MRDEPRPAAQLLHLVKTSDTVGHEQRIPASMRSLLERFLGRHAVGLRVRGEKRRTTMWGWDEEVKMLNENFDECKNNATNWDMMCIGGPFT